MDILTDDQLLRYSRHLLLPGMDIDGQLKLIDSRILVIGMGGLGCACTPYLASSGVGTLTLVDDDVVELSNLQRQILYTDQDVGQPKAVVASRRLQAMNPDCDMTAIQKRLNDQELEQLIAHHDVVIDCSDNLSTREQINRICFESKTPLVSGAAIRFEGQVSTFSYQENTACYRCLSQQIGEQSLNCAESGVLAPMVGIIGSMQAMEAIKTCANVGQVLENRLLMIDGKSMEVRTFTLNKHPDCSVCS